MLKKNKPPKEKKEKKKRSKNSGEDKQLPFITKAMANNESILRNVQKENQDISEELKSKKGSKKKLLKFGIPILLVLLIAAGAAFFILKSGFFSGGGAASGNHEDPAVKEKEYTQAQDYYSAGKYFDASAMFTLLADYEDSKEMLEKIDLNSHYPDNGAKIAEYIGSDVVNNYVHSYKNFKDINTALVIKEETTEAPEKENPEESSTGTHENTPEKSINKRTSKTNQIASSETTEESTAESNKSTSEQTTEESTSGSHESTTEETENTEKKNEEEKTEEKIEYDEAVKETVKEKTNELITAGHLVESLNLSSDNVLYKAHESLKKSAEFSIEAATKIQEGVEAGTYSPDGTNEASQEVKTLLAEMKAENDIFVAEIEKIINQDGLAFVRYANTGECMKRFSESVVAFYAK